MFHSTGLNIFQIYITDSDSDPIPHQIVNCIKSINELRGDHSHFLLRSSDVMDVLRINFGGEVLNAYNKLKPYAFKADLARYCLVYLYGGWYFDVTAKIYKGLINTSNVDYVVFKDGPTSGNTSWGVNNAVFHSKSKTKFLEKSIEKIIENCHKDYYGSNCLNVTGPGVFGEMLCKFAEPDNGIIGSFLSLTPTHNKKNVAYVLPEGEIFAFGKESAGSVNGNGLHSLGASGVNSYSNMWAIRDIYNH